MQAHTNTRSRMHAYARQQTYGNQAVQGRGVLTKVWSSGRRGTISCSQWFVCVYVYVYVYVYVHMCMYMYVFA